MNDPVLEKITKRGAKKYRYDRECYLHHNRIELVNLDQIYELFESYKLSRNFSDSFGEWCDICKSEGFKII